MKSISRFIVFFLTTCLLINLIGVNKISAQPVDTDQAKLVARNFYADIVSRRKVTVTKGISAQNLEMVLVHKEKGDISNPSDQKKGIQALPVYYIFNVEDKTNPKDKSGFVIISADQRAPAILGYSFTGELSENDDLPAFKDWMDHYKKQIVYVIQNNLKPDPKISEVWKKYSSTTESKGNEQLSEVTPMLTTKWSQRSYCNNLCPADADVSCGGSLNQHVPAGCAAIAMAQIMNYYEYPIANNPIPGYVDPLTVYDFPGSPLNGTSISYGSIPAVGVTTYDWGNMRDDINIAITTNPPTTAQINAVSTLIYHCGVALQMDYGPPHKGSGAGSPLNAFVVYFKYSPSIQEISKSIYSDEDWANTLRTELNADRLIYYAGYMNDALEGGHAFVCDGYQDVDPGNLGRYFHFCWGEGGGGGNGYYNLNDLTPGTSDYTFKQKAIIGISPYQTSTIIDADGNQYNTVTIGEQTWMAENLKTTKYNDGTNIPLETSNTAWTALKTPAYCWYGNDGATYKPLYGALYNWYTVNTRRLCPSGWHVPSNTEWSTLESFLGGTSVAGGKLKETGTTHWSSPNTRATNETGFTALPGGYRDGNFWSIGIVGEFWSSTQTGSNAANDIELRENSASILAGGNRYLMTGYSVRCIKGEAGVEPLPGDAGAFTYGYIGTAGEEHWYRFLTGMAGTYAIQTFGNTDTYMYLYNSDQTTLISEDNDGAGAGNSKITRNLSANTWYYVKITGYNSSTGSYQIGVNTLPEAPTGNNVTVTYDGLLHTASASVPSGISVVWYDAATGGNVTTQPAGINYGSYPAYAEAVNDVTGFTSVLRTKVTLTIDQRLATWTTNTNHKNYGDADPGPLTTGSGSNFVVADGVTASYNRASGETAGDYHITATLGPVGVLSNYTITNTGATFTIDKKVASVTPNAASKYCGQTDPVFTGSLTGFLPGDEVSATYSRTAGESVEGSPYTISGTLSPVNVLSNYDIAYKTANLVIMSVSIDASQSSNPVPVGSPSITLSAKVSDAGSNPVPGVEVWFSVENGNNEITSYPAVFTDGSGMANLTLYEQLASMADVLRITAVAGQGCGSAATSIAYLAVYDPTGGFVTGGGWINSPAGAYSADPALTGKANFGFVSKYKKGSNIPDGNTEFQFHEGNLNFSSSSYDLGSLVIAGYKAIYKGVGTINGTGNYKFIVSAVDGDVSGGGGYDKFRIKIWNKTDNTIVYDNNLGKDENDIPATVLGGGSIVIHKSKENNTKSIQTTEFELKVYPNPFSDHIFFELLLPSDSKVRIEISDINGTLRKTMNDMVVGYDLYRFEYVPENSNNGIFFYRVIVNGQEMFNGKLIRY